jgi:glycerophosphoryl diester phosphodiesterase
MIKKVMSLVIVLLILWVAASFSRAIFTPKGSDSEGKIITGHRGGAGLGLENSIECIERGMAAGATSIEIDVHITADGKVVVCHDPTLDRTTDTSGAINDLTLDQIKAARLTNANGEATEQTIPTLEQVLQTIDGRVELLLEINRTKGNNPGIESAVLNILKEHNALSYTVIQSFDDSVLETLHTLDPSLKLEKLLFGKILGLPLIFDGTLTRFSTDKYHYIRSFNFYHKALSAPLSRYLHSKGYRTRIWTVNDPKTLKAVALDGIITDRPDLM